MKRQFIILVAVFTILQSTTTFAWDKKGDSLVAEVAFNYVKPTTGKVLTEYLDGDQYGMPPIGWTISKLQKILFLDLF